MNSKSAYEIRLFQLADQARVECLVLSIQRHEYGLDLSAENQPDLRDVAGFFSGARSAFWVAEADEDGVVGCIGLQDLGGDACAMRKFMVHASWRGARGVAQALLAVFEGHALLQGMPLMSLSTVSNTVAAQRFYERNHFTRCDRTAMPANFTPGALDSVFFLKRQAGA